MMISEDKKNEFLAQFGKRFGEIKKEKGMTYRSIDENCDLDFSFISKIQKGTENITLETILNLSIGLNVQPKELFDFIVNLEIEDNKK